MKNKARIMILNRIIFAAVLFATACAVPAHAWEVVAPVDHYPPWKFTENRDGAEGIDIQLIEALLKAVDCTPRYVKVPWKRCLTMMETGEADIMCGVLRRPQREAYMQFIEPPYKTRTTKVFYVRKGTRIDRYEDLRGMTVGTTLGAVYFPRFDEDAGLVKENVKFDVMNLRKLVAGRIDCFIATEETGDYHIRQEGQEHRVEKATFRYNEPLEVYFTISRQSRLMERLPELSEAVRRMIESGVVECILRSGPRGL